MRLTFLLAMTLTVNSIFAAKLPGKADVLRAMELANSHFQQKYPDAGAPTFVKKTRPSNLWTRGVYFEGLAALCDIEQQAGTAQYDANLKYIEDWGTAHGWTPRNGISTRDADDYCCSQTYVWWFENHAEPGCDSIISPTVNCIEKLIDIPESTHDWTWIDAIQMGLPVTTSLTRLTTDPIFAEQGWKMYSWTRDSLAGGLFNRDEGLWWRDKDFVPPYKEPNGCNCYWSRGNGWVYAALVRAMQDIMTTDGTDGTDGTDTHLADYRNDYMAMTEALVKCQRKDGFWNVSLLDDSHFGGKELTGTALFVYGMAWGVNHGFLPAKQYDKLIAKTWQAMVDDCLHTDGFLGFVQGTGKQPSDSQPVTYDGEPDFDDFGLGCFLLAGSEVYKLVD